MDTDRENIYIINRHNLDREFSIREILLCLLHENENLDLYKFLSLLRDSIDVICFFNLSEYFVSGWFSSGIWLTFPYIHSGQTQVVD